MKWKLFSFLFAGVLALSACGTDGDNTGTNDDAGKKDDNVEDTRYKNTSDDRNDGQALRNDENADKDRGDINRDNDRNKDDRADRNDNPRYDISKEAANRITDEVDGIDRAYVITTKNNAYVAAGLDEDHDGDRDNKRKNNDDANVNDRNDANDNKGDRDRDDNDRNMKNRADDAREVTDETKREIKDVIQDVDNDIDHVYVSTNPDFMDLAKSYANDMDKGKPVRGFFDQIGNMVERVFPQSGNNR